VVGSTTSTLGAAAGAARATAAEAECGWLDARRLLDAAVTAADLLSRRDRLRLRRTELEASADANAEAVSRLSRARAAQVVRPLLVGVDRAMTALDAAEKGVLAALDAAPADLGDAPEGKLRTHVRLLGRAAADDAAALGRLVEVEAGLEKRRRSLRSARAALDDLAAALAVDDGWLAGRQAARGGSRARVDRT